jgi:ribose 5-phosphate isomerase A
LETPSPAIELEKLAAARETALLIEPGMVVGLGSGSTVHRLIEVLAEVRSDAVFVAASPASTRRQANGLRVLSRDVAGSLDLAIDGADQIDLTGWVIKGGGAAQTREKILAAAAQRFVVIASSDKPVERLRPPVPLELVPLAVETTLAALGDARLRAHTPRSPDGGMIADFLGLVDELRELAKTRPIAGRRRARPLPARARRSRDRRARREHRSNSFRRGWLRAERSGRTVETWIDVIRAPASSCTSSRSKARARQRPPLQSRKSFSSSSRPSHSCPR